MDLQRTLRLEICHRRNFDLRWSDGQRHHGPGTNSGATFESTHDFAHLPSASEKDSPPLVGEMMFFWVMR